ncbi:MAG: Uma2 family endonuclease, partial [Bacteroidetes bacterium]|nr:Uma2 family endonuclease [Bacteroidota bacterium]
KKIEQIMGSSGIQSYLVTLLVSFLSQKLNLKEKVILANEFGLQFSKKTWRNIDLAIFERKNLKEHLLQDKYIPVPPEVVIEVDTKADITKYGYNYINKKTDDLLNFGVKKVIWILTKTKKVTIAESNKDWIITNWDKNINIINDINVNINSLLEM